ncbi:MAG TPA: ABC transporter permease [Acidimicrobiales bacterium]|nr:ABC transporter permease [Acidimicrobiales bacterium]
MIVRPDRAPAGLGRQALGWLGSRERWDAWCLLLATAVLLGAFVAIEPRWITGSTFQLLVVQYTPLALIAMAMTFSIIAGFIDLSPGSMVGLSGIVVGLVVSSTGQIWLALAAGLGVALAVGWLHTALVAGLRISSVVVTLGTYIWARGLCDAANGGAPISVGSGISRVVNASWGGFTVTAPVVLVAYLAGAYLLRRTRFGRYCYAVGGGEVYARRAGINVSAYTARIFLLMSLMIAVASFLTIGQIGSADAAAGTNLELDAIIAVVIGGSSLTGGTGSVGRTALGVVFMTVLNGGLANLGLAEASYDLYSGLAFVCVLSLQVLIRRRVVRAVERDDAPTELGIGTSPA